MQKTSLLFWILGMVITLMAAYESFFPDSTGLLFIRLFGLIALVFVCVSLMIGPLMVWRPATFAPLVEPRRAVGLLGFAFMLGHFVLVIIHQWGGDVSLAFYSFDTLIAIPAFVLFTLIALVSSDFALKKLGGPTWKKIQRLNYIAFILIVGHYFVSQKGPFIILPSGIVFVNLAELLVWGLIWATVILQVYGYHSRKKKLAQPPAPAG